MPLKFGDVNPLTVYGLRRCNHLPPHFEPIYFDAKVVDKVITDWVWEQLDGRFYFGDSYHTTASSSITMQKVIAFEEKSEASYFGLIMSSINKDGDR